MNFENFCLRSTHSCTAAWTSMRVVDHVWRFDSGHTKTATSLSTATVPMSLLQTPSLDHRLKRTSLQSCTSGWWRYRSRWCGETCVLSHTSFLSCAASNPVCFHSYFFLSHYSLSFSSIAAFSIVFPKNLPIFYIFPYVVFLSKKILAVFWLLQRQYVSFSLGVVAIKISWWGSVVRSWSSTGRENQHLNDHLILI